MNSEVYLIDENYIKNVSSISDNLDGKYLGPVILKTQQMQLMPLLGEKFYDKICDMVASGEIEKDENYKTLLDVYISSFMVQAVQAAIQIEIFAKIRNSGVVNYVDNSQTPCSLKDVQYLVATYQHDASYYAQRMNEWILNNKQYFPEYQPCNNKSNSTWSTYFQITI